MRRILDAWCITLRFLGWIMAFRPPTFNLFCNVWRGLGIGGNYAAPDATYACNLSLGKRVMTSINRSGITVLHPAIYAEVLFPKLTDIRAIWNGVGTDIIELPAGSKRFYSVIHVDDVGKGFSNEYRLALAFYDENGNGTLAGGPFPAPVPLP